MLLSVEELKVAFPHGGGFEEALCGVSFSLYKGEVYCLLGESGSGKTVLLKSILGLLPSSARVQGRVVFDGVDLLSLSQRELLGFRGRRIGMVFQEPLTALNPTMKVGEQVAEVLRFHLGMDREKAEERVIALFERLGIPEPSVRYHHYPHMFSGGMRQRVVIAMAIAASPELILADEPTTALDVTIQAQILELLRSIVDDEGSAMLFVTHDFAVAAEIGDRVGILFRGHMVEEGTVVDVMREPAHPYTRALIEAIPIPGRPFPDLFSQDVQVRYGACPYAGRCPEAEDICMEKEPPWVGLGDGHRVRCHRIT